MSDAFVGFDSAWSDKNNGGIAWASFRGSRLKDFGEPKPADFDEAARIIETLRDEHGFVLVAMDQPTLVPNETGSRPVERVAASLISALKSGVQYANRSREALFGAYAPVWSFIERFDARENPPAARAATSGLHMIEVYPALALPALEPSIMERKRAARYNPKKRSKNFSLDDWKLVASAVGRHADTLGLVPLSQWAGEHVALAKPVKRDQDLLDAAICLLIALQWRRAPRDRLAVIGDGRTGYMVTTVSPDTKEILDRAAKQKNVPIDAPWPSDAERAPSGTRATRMRRQEKPSSSPRSRARRQNTQKITRSSFGHMELRRYLVKIAREGRTVTYGEVAKEFGVKWSQGALSSLTAALSKLGEENMVGKEPLLMALVVNKKSRLPGQGFFNAIGPCPESDRRERHEDCLERIWAFRWLEG